MFLLQNLFVIYFNWIRDPNGHDPVGHDFFQNLPFPMSLIYISCSSCHVVNELKVSLIELMKTLCMQSGNNDMYMEHYWTALQKSQGLSNLICMLNQRQEKQRLKLEEMFKASMTLDLTDLVLKLSLFLVCLELLQKKMMAT